MGCGRFSWLPFFGLVCWQTLFCCLHVWHYCVVITQCQGVIVENLHIRLKEEIDRLDLSMAKMARRMGENDSQELRDVCTGRKRASAALIAKIAVSDTGADVLYILTGSRSAPVAPTAAALPESDLSPRHRALLDNYDHSDDAGKKIIEGTASLAAQSGQCGVKKSKAA